VPQIGPKNQDNKFPNKKFRQKDATNKRPINTPAMSKQINKQKNKTNKLTNQLGVLFQLHIPAM
jgi:hypothetical protein